MNKLLMAAGAALVLTVAFAAPALAWHPKADIVKKVQNQTTASAVSDANDAATAVSAKPGDIVKYIIEISNVGEADKRGYNDMANTVMTDTLPAGVELVSNPSQRQITEKLGTLKPGQKVTKEYQVKVVSTKDGNLIENSACVTGNSTANDSPQKDCDVANVKVKVPPVVEEPKKEILNKEVTRIPDTGPETVFASTVGLGVLSYGAHMFVRSKQQLRKASRR